jgi:hypothetical protein
MKKIKKKTVSTKPKDDERKPVFYENRSFFEKQWEYKKQKRKKK